MKLLILSALVLFSMSSVYAETCGDALLTAKNKMERAQRQCNMNPTPKCLQLVKAHGGVVEAQRNLCETIGYNAPNPNSSCAELISKARTLLAKVIKRCNESRSRVACDQVTQVENILWKLENETCAN